MSPVASVVAAAVARADEAFVPRRLGADFRRLVVSSWVANLGDGVALAAGPLLVASLTDNAFVVSLAALTLWAPPLVFGLTAGVLSDRFDRRRVVVVANVVRVVVLALLVAAVASGRATAGLVLVALALLATAEVFADNASATFAPMLVARDDLPVAASRISTAYITMNQLVGPPLGAALYGVGRAWPFAGQALLSAAAVLVILRIRLPGYDRGDTGTAGVLRDVAEGFRWTWQHPAVRALALTILVFNVTFGASWGVLVLWAQQRLGLGPFGYGMLTTVSAVGGLLGTGLYGWITRRVSLGDIMRVGLVLETLTHLAFALTRSAAVAYPIMFLFGAHAFIWGTTSTAVRQRAVPQRLQGRVGSVYMLAVYGGLVVGSAVGGALAHRFGVTAPFWFGFAGSAVFLVALWRSLSRIAHDDPVAPVERAERDR